MHLLCPETSTYCSLLMPMIVFTIGRVVCCSCFSIVLVNLGCLNLHRKTIDLVFLSSVFVWISVEGPSNLFAWLCLSSAYYRRGKTLTKVLLNLSKKWWHLNSVWTSKLKHVLFFNCICIFLWCFCFYCICIFLWCCIYLLRFVWSHLHTFFYQFLISSCN